MNRSTFSHLRQIKADSDSAATSDAPAEVSTDLATLISTKSPDEAGPIITLAVRNTSSRVLSRTVDEIDASTAMHERGVDSIVAVELRNWFSKTLKWTCLFSISWGVPLSCWEHLPRRSCTAREEPSHDLKCVRADSPKVLKELAGIKIYK